MRDRVRMLAVAAVMVVAIVVVLAAVVVVTLKVVMAVASLTAAAAVGHAIDRSIGLNIGHRFWVSDGAGKRGWRGIAV